MKSELSILWGQYRMIGFSVVGNDLLNVVLSFLVGRYTIVFVDRSFTSIVAGEGE